MWKQIIQAFRSAFGSKEVQGKITGLLATLVILYLLLVITNGVNSQNERKFRENNSNSGELVFRDGDIIFKQTPGKLSEHISRITGSPVTHCGIIYVEEGDIFVIEAGDPVSMTDLKEFVSSGVEKKFALKRYENLSREQQNIVVNEAKKYLNLPYDYNYKLDDEHLYCSELVFKAYIRGIDIRPGNLVYLKDLNYKGSEDFIKDLTGELPLERQIITPVEI
ncbi:MAG: YiiX/YebB-like N1pC/P60 family cysteine hydrolase [Vulcanimicrobiota bacterium]